MAKKLKKREVREALKELMFEAAPLSTNKGRFVHDPISRQLQTKDRRHSGHRIVFLEDEEGYVVQFDAYDDWRNHRDGMRDKSGIIKNIYPAQYNYKWHDNTILKEENYWNRRKKIEELRKKEKIRRIRKKKEKTKMYYTK